MQDIDERLRRMISGLNGAVRVKRLPQPDDEFFDLDKVSNKENKGDSGEFDK